MIIIFGSSRPDGNTKAAVKSFDPRQKAQFVNLKELNITPYDYEHHNKEDDYIPLMEEVVQHEYIILATPVYWYSMSSYMKMFIDRITDLLSIRKDLGRKLANKKLAIITSYSTYPPKGFEDAIEQTCKYMDINYLGCLYYYAGGDKQLLAENPEKVKQFQDKLGVS